MDKAAKTFKKDTLKCHVTYKRTHIKIPVGRDKCQFLPIVSQCAPPYILSHYTLYIYITFIPKLALNNIYTLITQSKPTIYRDKHNQYINL